MTKKLLYVPMEKVDSRLNSPILSAQDEIEKQSGWDLRMESIFAITIPALPRGFLPKICPHPGLSHPRFCPGGYVGVALEERAFVYKRFLPFLEFSL